MAPQTAIRVNQSELWLLKVSEEYLAELDERKGEETGKKGRNTARRRQLEKYFAYKDELSYVAAKMGFQMPMGHFAVLFYLPHPRTWRKWKILSHVGGPHRSKPDADNLLKGLFDALIPKKNRAGGETGKDDKELWCYSVFKYWCLPDDARIEIWEYDESEFLSAFELPNHAPTKKGPQQKLGGLP